MKNWIPNIITLTNLFLGCCALVALFEEQYLLVIVFLIAGAIADFLDGFVARSLRVQSNIGKELDSLADMITFGLVPGAILFVLMNIALELPSSQLNIITLPAFLITVFSAVRLAIFNTDNSNTSDFTGLATPASTSFIGGLLAIYHFNSFGMASLVSNYYFLLAVTLIFSFLLISKLKTFSLKFNGTGWQGNEWRYFFCICMIAIFVIFKEAGFSLVIVLYLLFSFIRNLTGSSPGIESV